jgi:hypothetical protein
MSIKNDMLALFNKMKLDGRIMERQKHGIMVCLPETDNPKTTAESRSIHLVKTYYKILARIIANRLRPTLLTW